MTTRNWLHQTLRVGRPSLPPTSETQTMSSSASRQTSSAPSSSGSDPAVARTRESLWPDRQLCRFGTMRLPVPNPEAESEPWVRDLRQHLQNDATATSDESWWSRSLLYWRASTGAMSSQPMLRLLRHPRPLKARQKCRFEHVRRTTSGNSRRQLRRKLENDSCQGLQTVSGAGIPSKRLV